MISAISSIFSVKKKWGAQKAKPEVTLQVSEAGWHINQSPETHTAKALVLQDDTRC